MLALLFLQVIDTFRPPQRPIDFPFRFCVNDVYRGQGSGIFLSGKVESGGICPNTKVCVSANTMLNDWQLMDGADVRFFLAFFPLLSASTSLTIC